MRAHTTGQFVHSYQPEPKPTFTVDPNLREQHFGIAEGHPWVLESTLDSSTPLEELWAKNMFPILYERDKTFPEGESLDDLADLAASLFSPIPNRGCEPLPMINDHPFGPGEKGVHSVNNIDTYNLAN